MPLNDRYCFFSAPQDVRIAFLGVPDKVRLMPGTRLYKWTDYPLIGRDGVVSPWWCYVQQTRLPCGLIAEGFRGSEDAAHGIGISHRDYQKIRTAVGEKFNNGLRNLLLIELRVGVWGFAGRAFGQREFVDQRREHVYLIGGKAQLWIPGLSEADVRLIPTC